MQWVKNDVGEIFIRQFESFVSRFLGNGHTSCIFQESCKDNLVVESNGDIYECDHFVYPQYKIGNINKSELKTMNSVQLTAQKNGFQRNVSNVYINLSAMVVALSIVLLKQTMRLFPIFAKVIKSFFNHGTLYERHGGVS